MSEPYRPDPRISPPPPEEDYWPLPPRVRAEVKRILDGEARRVAEEMLAAAKTQRGVHTEAIRERPPGDGLSPIGDAGVVSTVVDTAEAVPVSAIADIPVLATTASERREET